MYLVYLLPLFLIVAAALAIFAGPVLAVIAFVVFLLALGLYKFIGSGTEPEHAPVEGAPVTSGREEAEGGIWGEKWPEQRRGGEPTS